MDKTSKNQNVSKCSCEHRETEKKLYKKVFGFVSSRFLFFAIGFFISVAILTAYAAWDTPVSPGETLTAGKWNEVVNKISSMETVIAVHSQTITVPDCPAGWISLWDGYSLALSSLASGYTQSQDLGSSGSCLPQFRKMPIIECTDPNGDCDFFPATQDFSGWLATYTVNQFPTPETAPYPGISRCRVCSKPAPIVVVHSQTTTVPSCPTTEWTSLWEGYSYAVSSLSAGWTQSQDLGSPGSCLPQFRKMPIIECSNPNGDCEFYTPGDGSGWLTVYTADRAPEMNPDISRCRVCSK